jgi:hypothetical protein
LFPTTEEVSKIVGMRRIMKCETGRTEQVVVEGLRKTMTCNGTEHRTKNMGKYSVS